MKDQYLKLNESQTISVDSKWINFIQYCMEVNHCTLEELRIKNGKPEIAQVVKHTIKF